MEKKDLRKESLLLAALAKEMNALKEATEVNSLKEQIIGAVMQVRDKAILEKAAKALHDVLFPKKPMDSEELTATQGNR
jgi:hypothetical protein